MVEFINYLRVIATILITNSHYAGVWPISAMAAGGLLGNIIFFAASGFCLFKIKERFDKWYFKRILKIYPVMLIFSLIMGLVGLYPLNSGMDAVRLFLYPTRYIFIVWLMIAYAVFYLVAYLQKRFPDKKIVEFTLLGVFTAYIAVYLIFIDKTVYGIDNVEKPFILFLYFQSMLIGALFNKYSEKYAKVKWYNIVLAFVCLIAYLGSKLLFDRYENLAFLQIFNQLIIMACLYFVFATFMSLEGKLKKLNPKWNGIIRFLAGLTLYIYIVQFVIIAWLEHLAFPLDFFAISGLILVGAIVIYLIEKYVRKGIVALIGKAKKKEASAPESENKEEKIVGEENAEN